MSLKYPNKRKRKDYWKVYERARIKDFRKLWNFAKQIVEEQGNPYKKKDNRGRKPNLSYIENAAICILLVCFDLSLRDAEGKILLLTNKTLDHSNIDRWFEKLDEEYVYKAARKLGAKIESMFNDGCYIADSTEYTTTRYYELIDTGERAIELLTLKLHILICYIGSAGLLVLRNCFASHGDAHDSPIFRDYLLENVILQSGRMLHADCAYFAIENIRKCKQLGLKPNFVPKENIEHSLTLKIAIKEYDNEARKQNRGLVEGFFGGTTTETDNKIRFVKDRCRKTYLGLVALKHQIRTYFRAIEIKSLICWVIFATTPEITKTI